MQSIPFIQYLVLISSYTQMIKLVISFYYMEGTAIIILNVVLLLICKIEGLK